MATIADIIDKAEAVLGPWEGQDVALVTRADFERAMRMPGGRAQYTDARTIREKWNSLQYYPIHAKQPVPDPKSGKYFLDVELARRLAREVRYGA